MAHPVTPNFPSLASLIQACKSGLERLPYFCLIVGLALPASALTLHRSFRTRVAGFGLGTGKATVAYPVDAKVDKALDEAAEKDVAKDNVVIGKCTHVSVGDTVWVVGNHQSNIKVRFDRIDAPEKDKPYDKMNRRSENDIF